MQCVHTAVQPIRGHTVHSPRKNNLLGLSNANTHRSNRIIVIIK